MFAPTPARHALAPLAALALATGLLGACDSGGGDTKVKSAISKRGGKAKADAKKTTRDKDRARDLKRVVELEIALADEQKTCSESPGVLNHTVIDDAAAFSQIEKFKIEVGDKGRLRYLSVYHKDAGAVPEAVLKAIPKELADGTIHTYEREQHKDGPRYEVEVTTKDGRECEYSAKPDGAVVYVECKLPAKELPAEVRDAALAAVKGGTIVEAEKIERTGGGVEFGVEVELKGNGTTGAELHEVYLDPKGDLLRHHRHVPATVAIPVTVNG